MRFALPFLLLVACVPNLKLPDNAQVWCANDKECPTGYVCSAGLRRCVLPSTNQPPTLSLGAIAQSVDLVHIPMTLFDTEADTIGFTVELSQGGSFQTIDVTISNEQGSPEGAASDIVWNAAEFFGNTARHEGLVVRVTPRDKFDQSAAVSSQPFSFGNDAPTVDPFPVVVAADGTVSGNVALRFSLADADRDRVSLSSFEISLTGDFSTHSKSVDLDALNFPESTLSDLETSPDGVEHVIVWNSGIAAPVRQTGVKLRFSVIDRFGATSLLEVFGTINVDNAPRVSLLPLQLGTAVRPVNTVPISFTVADPNALDTVALAFEYTVEDPAAPSATWFAATPHASSASTTGLLGNGAQRTFVWNALADAQDATKPLGAADTTAVDGALQPTTRYAPRVTLRARPTDSSGLSGDMATSASFALGDDATTSAIAPLIGAKNGEIPVGFALSDSSGDPVDVELQFKLDGDPIWRTPALSFGSLGGLSSAPTPGNEHLVTWNTRVPRDEAGTVPQGIGQKALSHVSIRMRGSAMIDGVTRRYGAWTTPEVIDAIVNETPPRFSDVTTPHASYAAGAGPVAIQYHLIDEESDPIDVHVECSFDVGITWHDCVEFRAPQSEGSYNLASAPAAFVGNGILHTFMWDATRQLSTPAVSTIRLTASDGQQQTSTTVFLPRAAGPMTSALSVPAYSSYTLPFPSTPREFTITDFNEDGFPDVAIVNAINNGGSVLVYLSDTAGGVIFKQSILGFPGDVDPIAVGSGDFNGDGHKDIAATYATGDYVLIFPGSGDGTFAGPTSVNTRIADEGYNPVVPVGLDINNDGFDDLFTINNSDFTVRMSSGPTGSLSFVGPVIIFPAESGLHLFTTLASAGVSDLDDDGDLDVVVSSQKQNKIYRLINGPTGLQMQPTLLPTTRPYQPSFPDVNSDGVRDLVAGSAYWLGTGNGDFGEEHTLPAGNLTDHQLIDMDHDGSLDIVGLANQRLVFMPFNPRTRGYDPTHFLPIDSGVFKMAASDWNRDGLQDFIMNNGALGGNNNVLFYLSNNLSSVSHFSAQHSNLLSADLVTDIDGNGLPDTVSAQGVSFNEGNSAIGSGQYTPYAFAPLDPYPSPYGTYAPPRTMADFNNDGFADLVSVAPTGPMNTTGPVIISVGLGDAARAFTQKSTIDVDDRISTFVTGDFNTDGFVDVVFGSIDTSEITTILGHGDGEFDRVDNASDVAPYRSPARMIARDLDNDGDLDLVVNLSYSEGGGEGVPVDRLSIYLGNNDGTFTLTYGPSDDGKVLQLTTTDLDDDGLADVVFTAVVTSIDFVPKLRVVRNTGLGSFAAATTLLTDTGGVFGLMHADGDGRLDLVDSFSSGGPLMIRQGLGDGLFATSGPVLGLSPSSINITDLDGDMLPDLLVNQGICSGQLEGVTSFSRALFPWGPGQLATRAFGAVAPTGLDRFGQPILEDYISMQPARIDVAGRTDFRETVGLLAPTGERRSSFSGAWNILGDIRVTRVADPLLASTAVGHRLKVEQRYGPLVSSADFDHQGLSLTGADDRAIAFELPILTSFDSAEIAAAVSAGKLRVYVVTPDWRRANQAPADPAFGLMAAGAYLPRILVPGASPPEYRDLFVRQPRLKALAYSADQSLESGTGARYTVINDPLHPRVRILTDVLGTFQAFIVP